MIKPSPTWNVSDYILFCELYTSLTRWYFLSQDSLSVEYVENLSRLGPFTQHRYQQILNNKITEACHERGPSDPLYEASHVIADTVTNPMIESSNPTVKSVTDTLDQGSLYMMTAFIKT